MIKINQNVALITRLQFAVTCDKVQDSPAKTRLGITDYCAYAALRGLWRVLGKGYHMSIIIDKAINGALEIFSAIIVGVEDSAK
ncbi:hypothetical protein NQ318_021730 [Aromia moschata]|uniref:Uncharacterized protein n=1 Tax=Aromia moschata TaxID=1265417 RepID=A0AAV8Y0M6_9CUCU|nr:hypothetical protein NQ318_021730 [Aromia moschata]